MSDLQYTGGYQVLRVMGKGSKPAEIPLPIPVLRAIHAAVAGRPAGPILVGHDGEAMNHGAAARLLTKVVHLAGLSTPASPHALRRTFCTAGSSAGSRCGTCSTPCGTPPTPAPPSAMAGSGPTSTGTPPTASPPTSQAWLG